MIKLGCTELFEKPFTLLNDDLICPHLTANFNFDKSGQTLEILTKSLTKDLSGLEMF
ncbi:hypothetical protein GCM10007940_15650 [Portibacter lacus]|uniref:Uncharacterized protein n=1 Tax=Portibacter lacus TaxID=1099794 RepID=A0AA37WFG2_9BACT|nr:hypothetical protein GCM10007940_15650 [Portibacter lacus]